MLTLKVSNIRIPVCQENTFLRIEFIIMERTPVTFGPGVFFILEGFYG